MHPLLHEDTLLHMALMRSAQASGPMLDAQYLDTPLGAMLAIASTQEVYFLGYTDNTPTSLHILQRFLHKTSAHITLQSNAIITSLKQAIHSYCSGLTTTYKIPCHLIGSTFQKHVWNSLPAVAYGTTCSYQDYAQALGHSRAYRAVAHALAYNPIVLILPCHRIITAQGTLAGYSGGIHRKKWLLTHEYNK